MKTARNLCACEMGPTTRIKGQNLPAEEGVILAQEGRGMKLTPTCDGRSESETVTETEVKHFTPTTLGHHSVRPSSLQHTRVVFLPSSKVAEAIASWD